MINAKSEGFTDEERAAMKERAQELKAEARAKKDKAEGESAVLAKIAELLGRVLSRLPVDVVVTAL
jgi:hypothetical protein